MPIKLLRRKDNCQRVKKIIKWKPRQRFKGSFIQMDILKSQHAFKPYWGLLYSTKQEIKDIYIID